MCADTELEAEVEPSLETEQRLAREQAARAEAERKQQEELSAIAQVRLAAPNCCTRSTQCTAFLFVQ